MKRPHNLLGIAVSRRALLAGAAATAAASLAACSNDLSTPAIERLIANQFGLAIAVTPAARAFASDMAARLAANHPCLNPWAVCETPEARIALAFLESTDFLALRAQSAPAEDLAYAGLFDPYMTPCASQLVAPL